MDQRAEHLIHIIEKIGAPLMRASVHVVPGDDAKKHAQIVAELLTHSVKLGIDISSLADFGQSEGDSVRVALSALSADFVASLYERQKKAPQSEDFEKIKSALQAVLTFSENFTVSPDNTARLQVLSAKGAQFDNAQLNIQFLHAFLPLVNAIGAFSFGQQEQKLIADVSARLTQDAQTLRTQFLPDVAEADQLAADVAILNAFVSIFTACYEDEKNRLAQSGEAPAGNPLDAVWASYGVRIAMVEALAGSVLSGAGSSAVASGSVAPIQQKKPEKPVQLEGAQTTAAPPSSAQAAEDKQANPLAKFAKKPSAEASAPEASSEVSLQDVPPAPPPSNDSDEGEEASDSSNPMSFFKKGG